MLIDKVKTIFSNRFVKNAGWTGAAELVNRIFRLATTVVIARSLSSYDYGLVAVVLTVNEFSTVFTMRSGIGSKIVQSEEQSVHAFCNTAYWMNWILCVSLFIIQCLAAFAIAAYYGNNQVILPICVVALSYLFLPTFAIQSALIYRENRLKIPAICNAVQTSLANVLTIIFALLGLKMWAIVLPILLTTPVWVIIMRRSHPWRISGSFSLQHWREILDFSSNVLGVELLSKLRANLDYLIIGRYIGIDALGIYYFAFNAGLGISLSLMQAFTWSLFPHLCDVRENIKELRKQYFGSLKVIATVFVPLIILQSSMAPFYVPIVFGSKWIVAIPILVVICLSALPRPFADAASVLLQSTNRSRIDLYWNVVFTIAFAICLLFAVHWGIFWVAVTVLASHMLALPLFTMWATRYVFRSKSVSFAP